LSQPLGEAQIKIGSLTDRKNNDSSQIKEEDNSKLQDYNKETK